MVQIHLLGGVSASTDGGAPVDVGPAKCRTVLAALALAPGEAVPVSRLVETVWGESPPRTAEKTLQGYVADLRKGLGQAAIARVGAAYRLEVGQEGIDVARFVRQVRAGEVEAALAEWRGTPLAGLDVPGLQPAVDGLIEQWLGAAEADLQRRVVADPPAVVAPLTRLTADHPFREELWVLLMTALYRSGRQADALAAYQRARQHLVTELGVEPGPRLREVERLILAQDERLRGPAAPAVPAGRGTLPRRLGRLLGREEDLAAVLATLAGRAPVVTLVGPGGIGKTSLALAAADRWREDGADRVWLAELGEVAATAAVPRAVADALGIVEGAGTTLTDSIVASLRSRSSLLVLDNCEHVLDGAAALATAVAEHAPSAQVLATSREGLGIGEEQLITVGPLDPAGAAVELFVERARAVRAEVDLDGSRPEVAEICRRLDGMPLAIELAAARSRSLSPAQLLARLDDRLRLLTRRTGTDRHRTLRATIAWSYELLSPAEQLLFQRLAVFTAGFDLDAAEAVASFDGLDATEIATVLGDLVDRSMVTVEPGRFGRRFRLLETLRHFALEQLSAEDREEAARRHAQWCREQVVSIHRLLAGVGEVDGVARLGQLWPDLRTALDRACVTGDVALADALVRPIAPEVNLRRQAEIGDWAERILELVPAEDEEQVVFWLLWASERHAQAGDEQMYQQVVAQHGHTDHPLVRYTHAYLYDDGEQGYAAALAAREWLRARGEEQAANLVEVAGVAAHLMSLAQFSELDTLAAEMERRYRAQGSPTMLYFALGMRGYSAQFQGRRVQAARFFAASGEIDVPAGTFLVNRTVHARTLFDQGETARALQLLAEHVDDLLDTDYADAVRMVAMEFVYMTAALDRLAAAARVLAYLDTVGAFSAMLRRTLLADAAAKIDAYLSRDDSSRDDSSRADSGREDSGLADPRMADLAEPMDARQALAYMRDVLNELSGER